MAIDFPPLGYCAFALRALTTTLLAAAIALPIACKSSAPPDQSVLVCAQAADCTIHVQPGGDDLQTRVQSILIDAPSGSTICFDDGTYAFTDELSVAQRGITLEGTSCHTTFDFRDMRETARNGLLATGDDFTIENLTIENTAGDAIRVEGATGVTFAHLRILWEDDAMRVDDAGIPRSGAYAIYPVQCDQVLVDTCEVSQARDAAIYVGQSHESIVKDSKTHDNVAGIEIENGTDAEVYGNESWNNTAGILVFDLPDLPRQDGRRAHVHDNHIHDNNHDNFGVPGQIVSEVPHGLGVVVMASSQTDIHDNVIENNDSTGVFILSCYTQNGLKDCKSAAPYHEWPEATFVHDNRFANNGGNADRAFFLIHSQPLEDVLWDGDVDPAHASDPGARTCVVRNGDARFRDFDARHVGANQSTDASLVDCEQASLPQVGW